MLSENPKLIYNSTVDANECVCVSSVVFFMSRPMKHHFRHWNSANDKECCYHPSRRKRERERQPMKHILLYIYIPYRMDTFTYIITITYSVYCGIRLWLPAIVLENIELRKPVRPNKNWRRVRERKWQETRSGMKNRKINDSQCRKI